MKICFASDVHYPNYTKRIQESALKCFLDTELYNYDIHYYVSTNRPKDLENHNNKNNVKIFDIDELRKNNYKSIQYELLPENPSGLYPAKYPWNLRRFIIERAANDGFDYIIYVDADLMFRDGIDGKTIKEILVSKYEPNKLKSNVTIFHYSPDSTSEVFGLHNQYLKTLDYDFTNKDLNTVDGPVMVFMGETNKDILKLCSIWNQITDFGYEKKFGFGYDNFFIANLSFVIPMSGFKLVSDDFPFYPNHIFEDRYDANYVDKENEFEYSENENFVKVNFNLINNEHNFEKEKINNENLQNIGLKYGTDKVNHGYLPIYEKYLNPLKDQKINFMEIGVDNGLSIKIWAEYFKN
jgi:hypothetical protein